MEGEPPTPWDPEKDLAGTSSRITPPPRSRARRASPRPHGTPKDLAGTSRFRCTSNLKHTMGGHNAKKPHHLILRYTVAGPLQARSKLDVLYRSAGSSGREVFCGRVRDLVLPVGYFFSASAATGDTAADTQDVITFAVTPLSSSDTPSEDDAEHSFDPEADAAQRRHYDTLDEVEDEALLRETHPADGGGVGDDGLEDDASPA